MTIFNDIPFYEFLAHQPDYTYLTVDLKTNKVLAELPLTSVSYGEKLSKPGPASGVIALNQDTRKFNIKNVTVPGRTGLYILRDGVLVWGGIIWKRMRSSTDRNVRLECETFESYFDHFFQNAVKGWEAVDQLTMAQELALEAAGEVLIDVDGGLSGVLRYKVAFPYEYKTVSSEISSIASLFNGFDWNIRTHMQVDGTFTRRLVWGYPQLGISRDSTKFLFEYPGNIKTYSITEDASKAGNYLTAIGGGEGLDQIESHAGAADLIASGWPRLDISTSYKDVFDPALLDDRARSDMAKYRVPVTILSVTVAATQDPVLGSYRPGDWARFRIDDDWYPDPLDVKLRMTGYNVTVNDDGSPETVALEMGGEGNAI